ncbi:MAG: hypothetical protein GF383_07805 [Candidatus Lokiarchaeota archaeon]|nr:hypothetical protein [Candidatus Lokiarchaeota archaeon]MBD3340176.1 hypothetical protein [Candidatus Lokiarchaeota archaeon]
MRTTKIKIKQSFGTKENRNHSLSMKYGHNLHNSIIDSAAATKTSLDERNDIPVNSST